MAHKARQAPHAPAVHAHMFVPGHTTVAAVSPLQAQSLSPQLSTVPPLQSLLPQSRVQVPVAEQFTVVPLQALAPLQLTVQG